MKMRTEKKVVIYAGNAADTITDGRACEAKERYDYIEWLYG